MELHSWQIMPNSLTVNPSNYPFHFRLMMSLMAIKPGVDFWKRVFEITFTN